VPGKWPSSPTGSHHATEPAPQRASVAPRSENWVNPGCLHVTQVATYASRKESGLTQFSFRGRPSMYCGLGRCWPCPECPDRQYTVPISVKQSGFPTATNESMVIGS
jgi:hypothetical protein